MKIENAPDVKEKIVRIVGVLGLDYIDCERIICFRSRGSKSDALARIWSLPKIWQKALKVKPHYIVEVLAEKYDGLSEDEKEKTIIHELLHIPKSFSGAVVSHNAVHFDGKGGHIRKRINSRTVEKIFKIYRSKRDES